MPALHGLYPDTDPHPSWEIRDRIGVARAFVLTTKEIYSNPTETFWGMPLDRGYGGPLFYAILSSVLGLTAFYVTFFITIILYVCFSNPLTTFSFASLVTSNKEMYLMIVYVSIITTITIALYAGGSHLMLCFQHESTRLFQATFRTICYTTGVVIQSTILYAIGILLVIQFVLLFIGKEHSSPHLIGSLLFLLLISVGMVTAVRLNSIALSEVHEIPFTTAQIAATIPLVVALTLTLAFWAFC